MRKIASHFLFLPLILAAADGLGPEERLLTEGVRAATLKAHVSFLASDALQGRDTPSPGLDVAAEYIAAQFRRAGLEPGGDGGTYFQNAAFVKVTQPMEGFRVRLETAGGKTWESTGEKVMAVLSGALKEKDLPVVKVSLAEGKVELPAAETVKGKALLVLMQRRTAELMARRAELLAMGPAVTITMGFIAPGGVRLREASAKPAAPSIVTSDSEFGTLAGTLPEGETGAKFSVEAPAPVESPVTLRNVIATLPGSDPALREQYVLLTAHYDHTGVSARGEDRINNGANDDASGVASVLTLAEAFGGMKTRPKRTLVFMTYFGEEKGLLGSRYYASHPVFPLRRTTANLNLEHMGRTDDSEGDRTGKITSTGFGYTTLGKVLQEAGAATGVEAWEHPKNSDDFFGRSDNQALADAGVPAVTLCVSWIFPDYHRPGDHWEKLNYENMERAVRTVGVLAKRVGDGPGVEWVSGNAKAEKYLKAYRKLVETDN